MIKLENIGRIKFIAQVVLLLNTLTAVSVMSAFAQDAQQKSAEEDRILETITVTARKRKVDIQEAPIAVSAVSGEDVEKSQVARLDNFNGYVPSLVISKNDGAGRVVSIRGVGWETAQNLSTQPSVLLYVDGIYLANPLALGLDLGEIERIEVLRGPQGPEFGQGTTGGAINIITKQARLAETGGALDFSLGDRDLLRAAGSANVSLGDRVAVRASVRKHQYDGFAEIRDGSLDGFQLDEADSILGNLSLLWQASDRFSLHLSASHHDSDHGGAAQKHVDDPNPDPRELTQDYPSTFALENQSLSAVITWDLPGGLVFRSLTGYQELDKEQTLDGDRLTEELTAVDLNGFGPANFDLLVYWDNNSKAFSQEFSLDGGNQRLDWVVGAYYLDHENFNDFLEAVGPGPVSQFEDQLNNPGPDTLPPFMPPLEFVETRTLSREDTALYGQMVFGLNERLDLTLGGRFQRDKSTDRTTQFWFNNSRQTLEDEAFTWKAGADLRVSDDHFLYFLVSTGWKNGGANPGAFNGALDVPETFNPEEVTAYELASKNSFFDDRARLRATVFYYDYREYQFIQEDPVPFAAGTGNIPNVEIYGAELEFSGLLGNQWRLDGHVSAQDGEIKDDLFTLDVVDFLNSGFVRFSPTGIEDRAGLRVNLRGNTPPKLVELSARLTLSHAYAFGDGSVLTSRLDYIHRGEYEYRVFNNPGVDRVPAYDTTGLFLGYDPAGLPLSLSLSVTNLFDEDGVNSRFTNPFGLHTTSQEFIPPREIIARVRYRF